MRVFGAPETWVQDNISLDCTIRRLRQSGAMLRTAKDIPQRARRSTIPSQADNIMMRLLLLAVVVVGVTVSIRAQTRVELRLSAPGHVRAGGTLRLRFEVSNFGRDGVYFKIPWKWASNAMRVVATSSNGRVYTTETRLYDIAQESVCTHFKALGPREDFRFEQSFTREEFGPQLRLPLGVYQLKWTYDVAHSEDEATCAGGGWPIWKGKAESSPVRLEVTP
jgi:hypothetical protein